jgi:Smr domain
MAPSPRKTTVDLHGHDVRTAVRLALTRVAEAYRNGFDSIELIHGAADVEEPVAEGRGRIKWELRRLAGSGAFDRYSHPDRTWLKSGSIVLTLRPNPQARRNSWEAEPPRSHYRRH